MKKSVLSLVALGALSLSLAACNSATQSVPSFPGGGALATPLPTNPPTSASSYIQFELLARPAVKEVFESFNNHKFTNAVEPYAGSPVDPLQGEIKAFTNTVRPPNAAAGTDFGTALQGILYPNEYSVNLASTNNASYLGVETGGATGGTFGGRDPNDDVVNISLGALFGKTLVSLGVQHEDNEENNCLSQENVTQDPTQMKTATFPYLTPPH